MTTVPPVDTGSFGPALAALRAAGLRAEVVDGFGPLPAGYSLAGAGVGDQEPEPGTRVPRGSIVRLNMEGVNPIPSPAVPKQRPKWVVVPKLVGLAEPVAARRLGGGLWPEILDVPPLPAAKSDRGLYAFAVASQHPRPGTRLPYFGRLLPSGGFRVSVVRLTLTLRQEGLAKRTLEPPGRATRPEAASSVAPIGPSVGAPCVLASERASHPGDEGRSAKPS